MYNNTNYEAIKLIKEHKYQEMIFNELRKNNNINQITIKNMRVQENKKNKNELHNILLNNIKRNINLNLDK
jgi:hypothetical protein